MLYSALIDTGTAYTAITFKSDGKTFGEIMHDATSAMYARYASKARKMTLLHVGKYISFQH